ncbi:hypothetical protein ACWGTO_08885 [Mesorhizobium sp. PL10]
MRQAYDLDAVVEKLKAKPRFKRLVDSIGRYRSACSIYEDLRSANGALRTLSAIESDADSRASFGAALTSFAIIMYCRAAVSDQQGRHKVDATREFSPDQKARHQAIANLRNSVVAHFGKPQGIHAENWNKERATLRFVDDQGGVRFVFDRANYLKDAVTDLYDIVATATVTTEKIIEERADKMGEEFVKLEGDADLSKALSDSPFLPEEFFKAPESLEEYWSGHASPREVYTPKPS